MNAENKIVNASRLRDLAARLGGCVDLVSLLGWSAETSSISSGALYSVSDLLGSIYDDFRCEIDSAEDCAEEEGRARTKKLCG